MLLCLICLAGCRISGISESTYNNAVKILDITDQYLDLTITQKEAYEKTQTLVKRFEKSDEANDSLIQAQCRSLSITIGISDISDQDVYQEILSSRNETAQKLGLKTKK